MALSAHLPDAWRSRLGRGLGHLARLFLTRPRRVAARNLALCFPELGAGERDALLQEHFCQLGEAALELGVIWRGPREGFEHLIRETSGLEHVRTAQAQGKGVILLGAHFGSWEAGALYCSLLGPLTAFYMPTHNLAFNAIMVAGRSRFGGKQAAKEKGFRPLLAALKRGELVGLLADQNVDPREGVFAPFFGRPASTTVAVARLARHSGAAVINAFCYRLPRGRGFRIVFAPMPPGYPSGDDAQDAAAMNAVLEAAIRRAPAQYWWVHRRFKDQPPGTPPVYY